MIPLPRTLRVKLPPQVGKDVEAHGRAMHRYLDDGQLRAFVNQPTSVRRTFGIGKRTLAKQSAAKAGLPQYGMVGPELYEAMRKDKAYDAVADKLLLDYMKPPTPSLVYPIDNDYPSRAPTFIHATGGIPGNYALDFMQSHGTPVLAPEAGTVSRTSGNDPATGVHGGNRDVFGWSVYLRCTFGFFYFTHLGQLRVKAGDMVTAGEIVGWVGAWPNDPGRSHLHLGYTSFTHLATVSKRHIVDVSQAARVQGHR